MTGAPDIETLRAGLARAAAFGIGVSAAPVSGVAAVQRLVVRQIRQTIMGRRLLFEVNGREILRIDARGGRLLSFASASGDVRATPEDLGTPERAAAALMGLAGWMAAELPEGAVLVRWEPLGVGAALAEQGIAAHQVAEAFGLQPLSAMAAPCDADPHARLLARAGAALLAAARLQDGLLYPLRGDEDQIDALVAAIETVLDDLDDAGGGALSRSLARGGLVILSMQDGQPDLALARAGQALFCATATSGRATELASAWTETTLAAPDR